MARKDVIILVEGPDDFLVVSTICEQEGLAETVQIIWYAQVGKLGDFLDSLVRDAGFDRVQRIGLTRDSDDGAERALQALRGTWARTLRTLANIERAVPQPFFFALPDNTTAGRLEDLCLRSPTFPQVLDCARQMYDCAKVVVHYELDQAKSVVAAYLAMMEGRELQLGTGALAGCWDLRSEAFMALRDFVRAVGQGV